MPKGKSLYIRTLIETLALAAIAFFSSSTAVADMKSAKLKRTHRSATAIDAYTQTRFIARMA